MEPHRLALPAGFRIENYEIQEVLGKGGFGITYAAYDWTLGRHMAIKELLPDTIATRIDGSTVVAMSASHEESWEWARERFVEEARTLAGFRHPNIIAVHRLIEANGTVYLVMDHLEGESYEARLRRIGREPDQAALMAVMKPILDGLEEVHSAGLLHRDIKPENILFDKRGNPILIDFGAARALVGSTVTMTSIVTHGYSPFEQYQTKGKVGPWTDIYAVGAVMCRAITGEKPPVAPDRMVEDEFQWLSNLGPAGYSPKFLQCVDWALRISTGERPTSFAEWRNFLDSVLSDDPIRSTEPPPIRETEPESQRATAEKAADSRRATKDSPFENSLGMKFVPVPRVNIFFSIWQTRVQDFQKFLSTSGLDQEAPDFIQTDADPVVCVSWEDAKAFCQWLTASERREGKIGNDQSYRLPTDAEWSLAVGLPRESGRTPKDKDAKIDKIYPWGTEWPPPQEVGNYAHSLDVDNFEYTSPAGSFPANQFGLYDMGGNVWEWCADWYDGVQEYRVVRGGSWDDGDRKFLSSSSRDYGDSSNRDDDIGFRCVLVGGSSR